jgi:isopentenyl diphosphate isomerase/L-lactate dehydrogenase-like FMN-dependent dehydrogenase
LFDCVAGGSGGEYTMRRNVEVFEGLVWRSKQAIYHEQIDSATEVLGVKLNHKVLARSGGLLDVLFPPDASSR